MTDDSQAEALLEQQRKQAQEQEEKEFEMGLSEAMSTWSEWIKQATDAGSNLAELFALEIKLALGDARRMVGLLIIALPVLLLAWTSFSGLISWLVGDYSSSVAFGLLTFLLLQLMALLSMRLLWRHYKRSLTLPLTREHLRAFIGDTREAEAGEMAETEKGKTSTSGTSPQ